MEDFGVANFDEEFDLEAPIRPMIDKENLTSRGFDERWIKSLPESFETLNDAGLWIFENRDDVEIAKKDLNQGAYKGAMKFQGKGRNAQGRNILGALVGEENSMYSDGPENRNTAYGFKWLVDTPTTETTIDGYNALPDHYYELYRKIHPEMNLPARSVETSEAYAKMKKKAKWNKKHFRSLDAKKRIHIALHLIEFTNVSFRESVPGFSGAFREFDVNYLKGKFKDEKWLELERFSDQRLFDALYVAAKKSPEKARFEALFPEEAGFLNRFSVNDYYTYFEKYKKYGSKYYKI